MVILIDQSSSMSELFFSADGEDYSVAHTAKHITDKCLFEILSTCISGNEIRPYVDLAIIGYGKMGQIRHKVASSVEGVQVISR